ncbi:MAG: OmpA family protein [Dysgonamonadaceae bacterium]|jgi:outer membrane protein OmpA-like peptidoglycan-associated protein|nr:OmpA family protein [Dysgonamonadaceae bacterium]
MKKGRNRKHLVLSKTFALMLSMMFPHIACAQTPENRQGTELSVYDEHDTAALANYMETGYCPHEIAVWGTGGFYSLGRQLPFGRNNNGFGSAFGVGYTYFWSKNWSLSSGLEYAFYRHKVGITDFSETYAIVDILGNPIDYKTQIDRYSETQKLGLLNIPLSIQYQTGGNHRFYALAGLKIGLPISTKYSGSNAVLTASGYYPDYNQTEIWQNDLGYGIFNLPENSGKLDLSVSLSGTFETGLKWNTGIGTALYTGVFADYGFTDMRKSGYAGKALVEYNSIVPNQPKMNTACILSGHFAPVSFGFKVKLAFSVGCRDWLQAKRAYKNMQSIGKRESDDDFYEFDTAALQAGSSKTDTTPVNPVAVIFADTIRIEAPDSTAARAEQERRAYLETAKERREKYSQSIRKLNGSLGNYALGMVTLTDEQKAVLDDYFKALVENPTFSLEITGYTCDLGTDDVNLRIGQERADLAKDYLVEKGIAPLRTVTFSKGESEPLLPNTSEKNRSENRRLEIKIREHE